jgi:HlyD family secretion protein
MRRTIIIVFVVVALILVAFFFIRQRQNEQQENVEIIRQASVENGKISSTVNATGSIEPEASVALSFGIGGTVHELEAIRGQRVEDGDELARLETAEMALTVQQAEDALRILELTLVQARNSAPSPATLAAAQADIDAAAGNLLIAEANLAAADATVAQAQAQKSQLLAGATAGQIAAADSQAASARLQQKNAQDAHDATLRCFTVNLPDGSDRESCPGLGAPEEQARANLEAANVALSAAEAQLADLMAGPSASDLQVSDAAITAAEAQVESAHGSILVAEANLARATAAYDRLTEGPTDDELAILEAQVNSGNTNLALAEMRLDKAVITSPIDGQVASVRINQGEQVSPGFAAILVLDEDAFHIEVSVDEIDIGQINMGQEVDIILDALPNESVSGVITEIAPTADTTGTGVVTYLVTINIESDEVPLKPGMTANASIVVEEMDGALIVPNWAIRLDRETGQAFVNRLLADKSIEEVPVVTGLRNEQFSEVISGLVEGDIVVVTNEREGFSFFGN